MVKLENRDDFERLTRSLQAKHQENEKRLISLCGGSGCGAYGTAKVNESLMKELTKHVVRLPRILRERADFGCSS